MRAGWVAPRPLSLDCRRLSAAVSSYGCFSGPPRPWIPLCVLTPSSYKDTSLPDGFILTDSSLKRACLQIQSHSESLGLHRVNSGESDSHHSAWDWDHFPNKSLSKQPLSQALFLRQGPPSFLLVAIFSSHCIRCSITVHLFLVKDFPCF